MTPQQPHEAECEVTITHTAINGTVLEGTEPIYGTPLGARVTEILKDKRWRWYRAGQFWFIPRSRDTAPKTWMISTTVTELEAAGVSVSVHIDSTSRPTDEVETDRVARQESRTTALESKARKREAAADTAHDRADALSSILPLGQPILVGHHSERKMRRLHEQIDSTTRAAMDVTAEADETRRRAEVAAQTTDIRYAPLKVARRIKRLEAEQRGVDRALEGYRNQLGDVFPAATGDYRQQLLERNTAVLDQIVYWRRIRDEQVSTGVVAAFNKDAVAKGDQILYSGRWLPVVRINAKSVTVEFGHSRPTVAYDEIRGHRRPEPLQ